MFDSEFTVGAAAIAVSRSHAFVLGVPLTDPHALTTRTPARVLLYLARKLQA